MGLGVQRNMLRFLRKHPTFISAFADTELFFPVMLAKAAVEGGYGTSNAARNRNNFFGIDNGRMVFSSPDRAFQFQRDLYFKEPYKSRDVLGAQTPVEQLRRMSDSGYYMMDNDGSLPRSITKDASWNNSRQRWVRPNGQVLKFTKEQSLNRYIDTLKPFIDDALAVIPFGKIKRRDLASITSSLSTKNI